MLKDKDGTELDFMCLTMINPASSWFKMVELLVIEEKSQTGKKIESEKIPNKTSKQIARLTNISQFCRYPRRKVVIHDNRSEFKCHFQDLCRTYGLIQKSASIKNPQANAILECVHQSAYGHSWVVMHFPGENVSPNGIP